MVLTYLLHHYLGWDPGVSVLLVIPIMIGWALSFKDPDKPGHRKPDEAQILLTLDFRSPRQCGALLMGLLPHGKNHLQTQRCYPRPILLSVPRLIAFLVGLAFSGSSGCS